jgi:deoxyribodipyrimidine photolyase-like uncharacterized protein
MKRFFNTTGPCNPQDHYMLPAEERLPALLPYVEQRQYFVVHAARQTGKTTAMRAFAERLRGLGYAAVWATLEDGQGVTETAEAEPIDMQYCVDLGLLRQKPKIEAANPIYREVLVRLLTLSRQPDLPEREWLRNGKLDVVALVDSFFVW